MAKAKKYGEQGTCSICHGPYTGFGHNPEPLGPFEARCCNDCNERFVIPIRIARVYRMYEKKEKAE